VGRRQPRIVLEHSFGTDTNIAKDVEDRLYAMVEQAGSRLRRRQRAARRMAVALSYSDGRRCVRQSRLDPATANDLALFPVARRVLHLAWTRRVRLRHLRLTCDRLVFPPTQLPLFETEQRVMARQTSLIAAMDRIRERFGTESVGMGRLVGSS
jgi:DNA polymerase-4